jgi:hypothetical protein
VSRLNHSREGCCSGVATAVDNHGVTLPIASTNHEQTGEPGDCCFEETERVLGFAVFGAAKSGSTWVQRLLSAHPQIHCAESRAFGSYFDPNNPTAVHLTIDSFVQNLSRYYHPPAGADDAFYKEMLFSIVDAIGRHTLGWSGKPVYGEKITPYWGTGGAVVDRLAVYNPGLRFVHLLRDPRDVVVSGFVHQANIRMGSGHTKAEHYRGCLDDQRVDDEILESSLSLWIDSNSAGLAAASRFERAMVLRYEDLVTEPIEQIGRLLSFLGVDHGIGVARHCSDQASFQSLSGGRPRGEEDRGSFFRKGVAGDWVQWLSASQLDTIRERAGELMGRLGYPAGAGS